MPLHDLFRVLMHAFTSLFCLMYVFRRIMFLSSFSMLQVLAIAFWKRVCCVVSWMRAAVFLLLFGPASLQGYKILLDVTFVSY